MSEKRFSAERNPDGSWSVIDHSAGRVANMHGVFLNRLSSQEIAEDFVALLNARDRGGEGIDQ